TRGWDAERGYTFSQRGKEEASDYRYFPDPDLVPVTVSPEQLAEYKAALVEPPASRRSRFQEDLGLSPYDASVIVQQGRAFAEYFEQVAQLAGDGKQAANWATQDVLRELNQRHETLEEFVITPQLLGTLLKRVTDGKITVKSGRELFAALLDEADESAAPTVDRIDQLIAERGLEVVSDTGALDTAIDAALADSPKAIEDFKAGKQQAVGAVIGKVMKSLKGADPKTVRERILQKLSEF
ncbi:MAG: Asp-tRNA(Asn)/Glu-tRNA(Gln) amidotransferase GatCAB subunit B, partial [Planctomycetaceae bacterium]|nr:Asp-tRNA(Asn)/Glu-tRNA(Gln) amidotransferase GatCAB subunit B [Planctomycetaceae bacterium]